MNRTSATTAGKVVLAVGLSGFFLGAAFSRGEDKEKDKPNYTVSWVGNSFSGANALCSYPPRQSNEQPALLSFLAWLR